MVIASESHWTNMQSKTENFAKNNLYLCYYYCYYYYHYYYYYFYYSLCSLNILFSLKPTRLYLDSWGECFNLLLGKFHRGLRL